jgi:hypothetical protein
MSWALLAEPDRSELVEPCSWANIAEAVRSRAADLQSEASDLLDWADLLDGLGELERRDD